MKEHCLGEEKHLIKTSEVFSTKCSWVLESPPCAFHSGVILAFYRGNQNSFVKIESVSHRFPIRNFS